MIGDIHLGKILIGRVDACQDARLPRSARDRIDLAFNHKKPILNYLGLSVAEDC
jgi:hypothetical protein